MEISVTFPFLMGGDGTPNRHEPNSIFREKFKFQKMGPNKMQMNANHYHYADIVSCARGKKNS